MDVDMVKMWVDIAQTCITFGLGVWLYLDRRNDKTQLRISELSSHIDMRLDNHATRLANAESEIKHLPTTKSLQELRKDFNNELGSVHEKINEVARSNGRIEGVLGGMQHIVEGINTYLRAR